MHWYVRSPTIASLQPLKARVLACLQAGADAAGCTMTHEWQDLAYADMLDSDAAAGRLRRPTPRRSAATSSRPTTPAAQSSARPTWATSATSCPSIHPMIQVAPPGVPIHTVDFARFAGGPGG